VGRDQSCAERAQTWCQLPEAVTVFSDPRAIDAPDIFEPNRFVIIGMSQVARMLFIVFAERGERIRIISARRANAAQRKKYEEDS
jgi:uncharacterized DUF497 family protein